MPSFLLFASTAGMITLRDQVRRPALGQIDKNSIRKKTQLIGRKLVFIPTVINPKTGECGIRCCHRRNGWDKTIASILKEWQVPLRPVDEWKCPSWSPVKSKWRHEGACVHWGVEVFTTRFYNPFPQRCLVKSWRQINAIGTMSQISHLRQNSAGNWQGLRPNVWTWQTGSH